MKSRFSNRRVPFIATLLIAAMSFFTLTAFVPAASMLSIRQPNLLAKSVRTIFPVQLGKINGGPTARSIKADSGRWAAMAVHYALQQTRINTAYGQRYAELYQAYKANPKLYVNGE